ncbi:hypothetical protein [Dorea sp.]
MLNKLFSGSDEDYSIKERFQRELDKAGNYEEREEVRQSFRDEMDKRFPGNAQAAFLKEHYFK